MPLSLTHDDPADDAQTTNKANLDAATAEGLSSFSFTDYSLMLTVILKLTDKSV